MDSRSDKKTGRPSQGTSRSGRKKDPSQKDKDGCQEGWKARETRTTRRNLRENAQVEDRIRSLLQAVRSQLFELEARIFWIERFGTSDMEEEILYLTNELTRMKEILKEFKKFLNKKNSND